jgi:hypothetical protein
MPIQKIGKVFFFLILFICDGFARMSHLRPGNALLTPWSSSSTESLSARKMKIDVEGTRATSRLVLILDYDHPRQNMAKLLIIYVQSCVTLTLGPVSPLSPGIPELPCFGEGKKPDHQFVTKKWSQ